MPWRTAGPARAAPGAAPTRPVRRRRPGPARHGAGQHAVQRPRPRRFPAPATTSTTVTSHRRSGSHCRHRPSSSRHVVRAVAAARRRNPYAPTHQEPGRYEEEPRPRRAAVGRDDLARRATTAGRDTADRTGHREPRARWSRRCPFASTMPIRRTPWSSASTRSVLTVPGVDREGLAHRIGLGAVDEEVPGAAGDLRVGRGVAEPQTAGERELAVDGHVDPTDLLGGLHDADPGGAGGRRAVVVDEGLGADALALGIGDDGVRHVAGEVGDAGQHLLRRGRAAGGTHRVRVPARRDGLVLRELPVPVVRGGRVTRRGCRWERGRRRRVASQGRSARAGPAAPVLRHLPLPQVRAPGTPSPRLHRPGPIAATSVRCRIMEDSSNRYLYALRRAPARWMSWSPAPSRTPPVLYPSGEIETMDRRDVDRTLRRGLRGIRVAATEGPPVTISPPRRSGGIGRRASLRG